MDKYLYRGVNAEKDAINCGELKPIAYKKPFKRRAVYGGGTHYGDGSVYGESARNAVVQHQKNSNKYPTSGVSTTPNYSNAVGYAKGAEGTKTGYVYTIDRSILKKFKVTEYVVDEHATKPTKPNDREVILVANDFGNIPIEVIVKKEKIS